MQDLSITQEYLICAVNERGRLPGFHPERLVCFVAAGLLELQLEGCVAIEGKTVRALRLLPKRRQYLQPLYDLIAQKQPVKLDTLIETYCISFTDQRARELLVAVGGSLAALGLAEEAAGGLLGGQRRYLPTREAVQSVAELLRAELLEAGEMTEDAAALAVLLEHGGCLKPYFSAFEQKELKQRLRILMDSPDGQLVRRLVEHIELILAAISASAGASASV